MELRQATKADLDLLAAFNEDLILEEGHRNPMSEEQLRDRMRVWLEKGEYQAWIAEEDGHPQGYALTRHDPEWLYIRQLFITPEARRKGMGTALVDAVINAAKLKDHRVRIEVLTKNAAGIAFWRSCGFGDYAITLEKEC